MAAHSGRHDADDSAADRARVEYLAGETNVELDPADRAELDELRELLADPTLWSEPPAELVDSVVALIAAQASATASPSDPPISAPTDPAPARVTDPAPAPVIDAAPAPPADLGAAREKRERRTGVRRFTRPVFLVAAAAAIVAIALSGTLILRNSTGQRTFDVALSATDLAPGAGGSATMLKTNSGWEIKLDATGLPRLDGGQFYQAWLRNADGVLVPIGTFNEGTDVTLWAGVPPDQFPTMTITRESADGNQDSSGERVLVGTAVEEAN
jgi:Anti-sigma-K factor rskA